MNRHRIEWCGREMQVIDRLGAQVESHEVGNGADAVYHAKMKLNEWKLSYPTIDYTRTCREISRVAAKQGAQS